jgi:hypothetical protein
MDLGDIFKMAENEVSVNPNPAPETRRDASRFWCGLSLCDLLEN